MMKTYITLIFLSWMTKRMTFASNINPLSSKKYWLNAYYVTEPEPVLDIEENNGSKSTHGPHLAGTPCG